MNAHNKINNVYNSADEIPFSNQSKIVIISDCHRGDGSWSDNFSKNQNLYFNALTHYYKNNYTYIELGDGDELWENKQLSDIKQAHSDVFWLLSKFYNEGRLHLLYGNHDIVKRDSEYVENNLFTFYDEREKKLVPLFENIKISEGLILNYKETGNKILLIHGHQGDFQNDDTWRISRFLVRYLWRPLEMYGINNPTSPAKNYKKKDKVSERLKKWCKKEDKMMIAGHTHKPMFPDVGEPLYFNDGSCIHPRCITSIEISGGCIMLVKWYVKVRGDSALCVDREVLAGPVMLKDYFRGASSESFGLSKKNSQ